MNTRLVILLLALILITGCSSQTGTTEQEAYSLNRGMVTFIFDDGHHTIYDNAYPIFKDKGLPAAVAINTGNWERGGEELMSAEEILTLQDSNWEVMSHSVSHKNNSKWLNSFGFIVEKELKESKETLESYGFEVNQYVAPMSTFPLNKHKDLLQTYYDAGFTTFKSSKEEHISELVMTSPLDVYEMHRANMEGKTIEELKEYVDYVEENDVWLVFYEHQIGGEDKYTDTETLKELLDYISEKDIQVTTGTEAIEVINSSE